MRRLALIVTAALACGGGEDAPPKQKTMATPATDAGVVAAAPPRPKPPPAPPSEEGWLDPTPGTPGWQPSGHAAPPPRTRSPIYLQLRSTPSGAVVMLDGERLGVTPTYWEGTTDGKPHDFTFILEDYAVERYRFVPTQSGHVWPRLKRLVKPEGTADAGP